MATEVRSSPRISVNKLGEYMVAKAARRSTIIRDQKRPMDFIVPVYTDAQDVISRFIADGGDNDQILTDAVARLQSEMLRPKGDWDRQRLSLCIEAIEQFSDMTDKLPFGEFHCQLGDRQPPRLVIEGVDVSVRPEIVIHGTRRNEPFVGAVKLCFSKSNPLGQEAGE